MALTGHLSDLSLSELIEFFCNQRKTGRLTVLYPQGPGSFFLQTGSVVDARIGVLKGIDAVYYALTLPNAKFEFSGADEPSERTINQPWTQVVLEGLRRLDEGIEPAEAFPVDYVSDDESISASTESATSQEPSKSGVEAPAFMSFFQNESSRSRKPFIVGAIVIAILGSVAAVGVPAGWYKRSKPAEAANVPAAAAENQPVSTAPETAAPASTDSEAQGTDAAALAAKRQRERERARARENSEPTIKTPSTNPAAETAKGGPKKVTVTVTYDESGRVTQASGADPTAIRIARQKRFPAGKAGSATVTIPIN